MKTNELTDAALDWAVAKAEGISLGPRGSIVYYHEGEPAMWHPSTDWSQAGPIIEREKIATNYSAKRDCWFAENFLETCAEGGPTPLIAAMRCYVASKLGDNIDIPKELT
jgi:hypothetical protein